MQTTFKNNFQKKFLYYKKRFSILILNPKWILFQKTGILTKLKKFILKLGYF